MNKEVHDMNINLNNINYFPDLIPGRKPDLTGKDVIATTPVQKSDPAINAKDIELKRQILEDTTMDINEIKNFLFMLIGSEIKLKPENNTSGAMLDRIA